MVLVTSHFRRARLGPHFAAVAARPHLARRDELDTSPSRLDHGAWQYPAHRILVEDHLAAITAARARRDRLTDAIEALLPDWRWAPVASALQAMRGIALISAVSLVAAIGGDGAVTRHYAVDAMGRAAREWHHWCLDPRQWSASCRSLMTSADPSSPSIKIAC
jgi:transposase